MKVLHLPIIRLKRYYIAIGKIQQLTRCWKAILFLVLQWSCMTVAGQCNTRKNTSEGKISGRGREKGLKYFLYITRCVSGSCIQLAQCQVSKCTWRARFILYESESFRCFSGRKSGSSHLYHHEDSTIFLLNFACVGCCVLQRSGQAEKRLK